MSGIFTYIYHKFKPNVGAYWAIGICKEFEMQHRIVETNCDVSFVILQRLPNLTTLHKHWETRNQTDGCKAISIDGNLLLVA